MEYELPSYKNTAKNVFDIEIESLRQVANLLDDQFDKVISVILNSTGKLVICGIGKSGLIGKKIAATLASTGTPSFFLHPAEAFHGDLGMISSQDIIVLISYSGETDELLKIVPFFTWNGNVLIAITGNPNSTLAKNAAFHLNVNVKQEACPLQLAPTSSTTCTLVMGDALAVGLMEARQFKSEDFARFHPGGSLGRKLLLKVKDIMRKDSLPFIDVEVPFTKLVISMSEGRLGMVIVGTPQEVHGIITDGDLRRGLVKYQDIQHVSVTELMNRNPVIIDENMLVFEAENKMRELKITTLMVCDSQNDQITGVYQIFN